jgi:hypothetical protein
MIHVIGEAVLLLAEVTRVSSSLEAMKYFIASNLWISISLLKTFQSNQKVNVSTVVIQNVILP